MSNHDPAENLRIALEMHEFGIQMIRQRLRRENPGASDDEIEALFRQFLRDAPHELSDQPGITVRRVES